MGAIIGGFVVITLFLALSNFITLIKKMVNDIIPVVTGVIIILAAVLFLPILAYLVSKFTTSDLAFYLIPIISGFVSMVGLAIYLASTEK